MGIKKAQKQKPKDEISFGFCFWAFLLRVIFIFCKTD
jgi:hypothetical protein